MLLKGNHIACPRVLTLARAHALGQANGLPGTSMSSRENGYGGESTDPDGGTAPVTSIPGASRQRSVATLMGSVLWHDSVRRCLALGAARRARRNQKRSRPLPLRLD